MDPNREANVSCANERDDCRLAYNDFHGFIEKYFQSGFMNSGLKQFEQGLLIDIHGQVHTEGWIELGYLLSAKDLDTVIFPQKTSIRQMASLSNFSFENLIRGIFFYAD